MSVIIDIFVFFVIIDIRRWAYVSCLIADAPLIPKWFKSVWPAKTAVKNASKNEMNELFGEFLASTLCLDPWWWVFSQALLKWCSGFQIIDIFAFWIQPRLLISVFGIGLGEINGYWSLTKYRCGWASLLGRTRRHQFSSSENDYGNTRILFLREESRMPSFARGSHSFGLWQSGRNPARSS